MNFDDILDDNRNGVLNPDYSMQHNDFLEFRQALISKKKDIANMPFSINREYVNSPAYHAKFEQIPVSKNVQEALYKQSGRLLEFVNNLDTDRQSQERLLAIDAKTGELIVDNFSRDGDTYRTGFNNEEYAKVSECPNQVILLHNHSLSTPPSGRDIMSCLKNDKIAMSVVVCHNGDIYTISDVRPEFEEKYNKYIDAHKQHTTNIYEAKDRAINDIYEYNKYLSERHQIMKIKQF